MAAKKATKPTAKPSRRAVPKRARGAKREEVLEAALDLFNKQGVGPVSTNHIADAASISPGNLYYHFKDKSDIVWILLVQFRERMQAHIQSKVTSQFYATRVAGAVELLWRYRFLFEDRGAVRRLDPRFAKAGAEIHQMFRGTMSRLIDRLAEQGHFRAGLSESDREFVLGNLWSICGGWADFAYASGKTAVSRSDVATALRHAFHFLLPYLSRSAQRLVRAHLETSDARTILRPPFE